MSPRQKMINLMYLVLTAMLALNVSTDVLDGFELVKHSVDRSAEAVEEGNCGRYLKLEAAHGLNPVKTSQAYARASELRRRADDICATIDSLKLQIALESDGRNGDPAALSNREDLDAAATVMLNPSTRKGTSLRESVSGFAGFAAALIPDSGRRSSALAPLALVPSESRKRESPGITWEEGAFSQMPAIAALTLLSKLQGDIRQSEAQTLEWLLAESDANDVRVNEIMAAVVPQASTVVSGMPFTARVFMAAVDTTARPEIWLGETRLPPGTNSVSIPTTGEGPRTARGRLKVTLPDGRVETREFSADYNVVPPMATVAPLMMNLLYSGIENPLSVSVPGINPADVAVSMTGGRLVRKGKNWSATPVSGIKECEISVKATVSGRQIDVAHTKFRVKALPDPVAFVALGQGNRYGGAPKRVARTALVNSPGLGAELDGDLPDLKFSVLDFSTVFLDAMGNAMPEPSEGNGFSERQKQRISRLKPGTSFFIAQIRAKGPDGKTRTLAPIQVTVN